MQQILVERNKFRIDTASPVFGNLPSLPLRPQRPCCCTASRMHLAQTRRSSPVGPDRFKLSGAPVVCPALTPFMSEKTL